MADRLDLTRPRYDQSTYLGRVKHFYSITDPRNILASEEELQKSKTLLQQYRNGKEPVGTTEEQLWRAKKLYDSAFHPQSEELMWLPGRMSFCVPGNMVISGAMLTFYRTTPAVVFWQVCNQSFNAVVNYVNRNASNEVSEMQLAQSFVVATSSATAVAIGLNKLVQRSPKLGGGIVGRLVPFAAVASANAVNIPFMRYSEIKHGIQVTDFDRNVIKDKDGNDIVSKNAAKQAVQSTLLSRVVMTIPGMTLPPITTTLIHKYSSIFKKMPKLELLWQTFICGLGIAFAMPLSMALFPQESSTKVSALEPEARESMHVAGLKDDDLVYFNKGL
eukprot:m.75591 g.75591  ORF g.75591 m.75591 type:complete len:332 (+) comp12510_c1_seq1:212-1207(+)